MRVSASSSVFSRFAVTMLSVGTLCLVGCGPRGETKTLEEVLQNERKAFYTEAEVKLPDDVRKELTSAATALEELSSGSEASSKTLDMLLSSLRSLQVRTGYTTRPALAELLTQWQALRESRQRGPAQVKLVTARTYGLLTSELKGVKFGLKERELKH